MQELEPRHGAARSPIQPEAILELKLPQGVACSSAPEPRQAPPVPAWAKALAADGDIEKESPRLRADVRSALTKFLEESPAFSRLGDQSLKRQTETQQALLKALGIPEGELVAMVMEGDLHTLGLAPRVTIRTKDGTLVQSLNGFFAFKAEANQLGEGSGIDQFQQNAQTLAKLLKQSPVELLRLQREKPVSDEFSKLLNSKMRESINAKPFADTTLSIYYSKPDDAVRLTLEHRSKDGASVFADISLPFSEFENPGLPTAKVYLSELLKLRLSNKDALSIDHGTKSVCPRGEVYNVLVPTSMSANALPLYGCEWKGATIKRYDAQTQKSEVVHELKEGQTAVFNFDAKLPGLRATILDSKKQEVATFSFKR